MTAESNNETEEDLRVFTAEVPSKAVSNRSLLLRDWKSSLIFLSALGAILWGVIASFGSGFGFWEFGTGFTGLRYSFFLAAGALIFGIIFIFWDRYKNKKIGWSLRIIGMVLALFYVGWMLNIIVTARSLPAIHDISTDLADPPQFQTLSVREDNLDNIPDGDEMQGLTPLQRWTRLHQEAYPNIRSVRIDMKVADVIAKAERLAEARGWDVALSVPEQGKLEATETTAIFAFKDDVVIRARPTQDGNASIIDMRSISRVGQSDLGANAQRIEAFLADLSGTTAAN